MAGVMHGRGVCVVGTCVAQGCVHGTHTLLPQQILQDTVNERVVRILLECILVVGKILIRRIIL